MPSLRLLPLAMALAVLPASEGSAEPSAARQDELLYRLRQDCGSCHGLTLKGGLGPALLPQAIAEKSSEALSDIILYGVPGTPMPPWAFEIDRDEVDWLVRRLKEGL